MSTNDSKHTWSVTVENLGCPVRPGGPGGVHVGLDPGSDEQDPLTPNPSKEHRQ